MNAIARSERPVSYAVLFPEVPLPDAIREKFLSIMAGIDASLSQQGRYIRYDLMPTVGMGKFTVPEYLAHGVISLLRAVPELAGSYISLREENG